MHISPLPRIEQTHIRRFAPQFAEIFLAILMMMFCVTDARADSPSPSEASANAVETWVERNSEESGGGSKVIQRRNHVDRSAVKAKNANVGAGFSGISTLLWPLIAVLVTIGILAVLARKWMGGTNRFSADGVIKVIGRQYLSNKQSLCLIRVGQRVVLLGVTSDRISSLCDICEPEEVAEIVSAAQRGTVGSFSAAFSLFSGTVAQREDDDHIAAETRQTVLPGRVAKTGAGVRDLLDRVRAFSHEKTSAEST